MTTVRAVILDNYDSFVFNLHQRIGELTGTESIVVRSDRVTVDEVAAMRPTHIVISPGPGNPENPAYFGICREVILELGKHTPLLGVCLGHQGITTTFSDHIVRANKVMHGKTSVVTHDGTGMFRNVESPAIAMRYHSLVVERETLPASLIINAETDDGLIMGLMHHELPIHGVQFHPESIGTPSGLQLLRNFLTFSR